MTSTNHHRDRELQAEARAWATFTGANYTAALRQLNTPAAQGLLGPRVSPRHLIATLSEHPVIGSRGGEAVLREHGMTVSGQNDDGPAWAFNGHDDFVQLALITDTLRMFGPVVHGAAPEVGSYSAKHTVERILHDSVSYVSNGRLIWAAAALGLTLSPRELDSPNVKIGLPPLEHNYARSLVTPGAQLPSADHHRPAGYGALTLRLQQLAAGQPIDPRWIPIAKRPVAHAFSDWLRAQSERDDPIGDLARDYAAGLDDSAHRIAETPEELLAILDEVGCSLRVYEVAQAAGVEWNNGN